MVQGPRCRVRVSGSDMAGLVFKAHRWLYHSTQGWRVIKKKLTPLGAMDVKRVALQNAFCTSLLTSDDIRVHIFLESDQILTFLDSCQTIPLGPGDVERVALRASLETEQGELARLAATRGDTSHKKPFSVL